MDILAAILPPLVVAVAFIALGRAAMRHADGRTERADRAGQRDGDDSGEPSA